MSLKVVMAVFPQNTIFFETPCIFGSLPQILSKGENFGSVYLLPFLSGDDDAEVGYRYRVTARIQSQHQRHFHTLRYVLLC